MTTTANKIDIKVTLIGVDYVEPMQPFSFDLYGSVYQFLERLDYVTAMVKSLRPEAHAVAFQFNNYKTVRKIDTVTEDREDETTKWR